MCWNGSLRGWRRECDFRHFPAAFGCREIRIIWFKPGPARKNAIGKKANVRVVVLHCVVISPAFHSNSVLCPCELILQTQKIFVRLKLRIILYDQEQPPERTLKLCVGSNTLRRRLRA